MTKIKFPVKCIDPEDGDVLGYAANRSQLEACHDANPRIRIEVVPISREEFETITTTGE